MLLSYLRPPQTTGRVGRILFVRDLGACAAAPPMAVRCPWM